MAMEQNSRGLQLLYVGWAAVASLQPTYTQKVGQ
jgi:hypothetical protein